jgi:hypothetical protein
MNPRAGGAHGQSLPEDGLSVAAELQAYAARVAPQPSAAFVDRVLAELERSPLPIAARGLRVRAAELANAAGIRLRVALAQVAGGSTIPVKLRLQAGAMLVVATLLITAGGALAAAGAASVANWVAGPQVPVVASQTPAAPTSDQHPSATLRKDQPQRTNNPTSRASAGAVPDPGAGSRASCNPGNHGKPAQSPDPTAGDQASCNPGNHGKPGQSPDPTAGDQASSDPGKGGKS